MRRPQVRRELPRTLALKVGVTLFLREGQQSLWENGISQNAYFLLMLLARAPAVAQGFIVNGGPADPSAAGGFLAHAPAPVIGMGDAMGTLDVVIELGAQLDPQWGRDFTRKGGVIVGMRVANDFVIDAERMVYDLDPGLLMSQVPYDEIWTLKAFEQTCASYYRTGFRAPVRTMPHLWSPMLLEQALADQGDARVFRYQPGRSRWRVAILEPNICSVKTCHLPLLLCDVAHRIDPCAIEHVRVYNALKLKEHRDFISYARSLDLVRQGLATFEGRFPVFDIMAVECDAVVSHHWENAQNYLYYEALHGGFPLIHNSSLLGECGYSYRAFDPEDGALALLQAIAAHDRDIESYRRCAEAFLAGLDPCSERNIGVFSQVLCQLCDRRSKAKSR